MYLGKRKNGYYFIEYFDAEEIRNRRISTGCKKKNEALRFLTMFESQKINIPKRKSTLLSSFKTQYIDFIGKTYSKKYLKSIEFSFNKFYEFLKKDVNIQQISTRVVQEYLSDTHKNSPSVAALHLRTLKAAFN